MSLDETLMRLSELRRLSVAICERLNDDKMLVEDLDACLAELATLRPGWQVVLVADVVLLHQSNGRIHERNVMSAAVRLPGGIAVGLLDAEPGDVAPNGQEQCCDVTRCRFLPFGQAPSLIQRLVLPLIPYTLEALCDQLESQI